MKGDIDLTRRFVAKLMEPMKSMDEGKTIDSDHAENTDHVDKENCIELRVFKAHYDRDGYVKPAIRYPRTFAGWYNDPLRLAIDAGRLRGVSGYVTVNPVMAMLLGRSNNVLSAINHASRNVDIRFIRWLFIDIDPVRPPDISSTDEELQWALGRRDDILADHVEIATSGLWGCSGNGGWILARLPDLAVTTKNLEVVGKVTGVLAGRYSDNRVEIDRKTKNAGRVCCLPGTYKCKGSSLPERPWRMVTWDNEGKGGRD